MSQQFPLLHPSYIPPNIIVIRSITSRARTHVFCAPTGRHDIGSQSQSERDSSKKTPSLPRRAPTSGVKSTVSPCLHCIDSTRELLPFLGLNLSMKNENRARTLSDKGGREREPCVGDASGDNFISLSVIVVDQNTHTSLGKGNCE